MISTNYLSSCICSSHFTHIFLSPVKWHTPIWKAYCIQTPKMSSPANKLTQRFQTSFSSLQRKAGDPGLTNARAKEDTKKNPKTPTKKPTKNQTEKLSTRLHQKDSNIESIILSLNLLWICTTVLWTGWRLGPLKFSSRDAFETTC